MICKQSEEGILLVPPVSRMKIRNWFLISLWCKALGNVENHLLLLLFREHLRGPTEAFLDAQAYRHQLSTIVVEIKLCVDD